MKQAALLLVLVLVALCCEAAPGPDCDGLNKTLTDTQKVNVDGRSTSTGCDLFCLLRPERTDRVLSRFWFSSAER